MTGTAPVKMARGASVDSVTRINPDAGQEGLGAGVSRLNFVGYLPGTLRRAFTEGMERILKAHFDATGTLLKTLVRSGPPSDMDNDIRAAESIEDLPDVIASAGFGPLFSRAFLKRLARKGLFRNASAAPLSPIFDEAGLSDPDGWFTVFGAQPFVLLQDQRGADDIPEVRKWSDLLDPALRGKVVLVKSDDPAEDVSLIYFYKEYGVEGLASLAANMKGACDASRIGPMMGSSRPERASIYILPWVYAKSCSGIDGVSAIWPEEGALVNPLCVIAKGEETAKANPVLQYIVGPDFGREGVRHGFASAHPDVENGLPEGARLKWLGWDYIKSRDVAELRERVHRLFAVLRRDIGRNAAKGE